MAKAQARRRCYTHTASSHTPTPLSCSNSLNGQQPTPIARVPLRLSWVHNNKSLTAIIHNIMPRPARAAQNCTQGIGPLYRVTFAE